MLPELIQHTETLNNLYTQYKNNNLANSIILNGYKSIGKSLLAKHLILKIISNSSSNIEQHATLLEKESHPDILIISQDDQKTINLDAIKKIPVFQSRTSSSNNHKFIFIKEINKFNDHAGNALLKILEELPTNIFCIMTSSNISKVIGTILSRSIVYNIKPLSNQNLEAIYSKINPEFSSKLITYANGSIYNLQQLHDYYDKIEDLAIKLLNCNNKKDRFQYCIAISELSTIDNYNFIISILLLVFYKQNNIKYIEYLLLKSSTIKSRLEYNCEIKPMLLEVLLCIE